MSLVKLFLRWFYRLLLLIIVGVVLMMGFEIYKTVNEQAKHNDNVETQ